MTKGISILLLALILTCWGGMVNASVILEYQGANFDDIRLTGPTTPTDVYTATDSVTGWIELTSALAANLIKQVVNPLSFSFIDGVNTIDDISATLSQFMFSTDSGGQVTGWEVLIKDEIFGPGATLRTITSTTGIGGISSEVFDLGEELLCDINSDANSCNPTGIAPSYNQSGQVRPVDSDPSSGVWSYSVPTPATLALFGIGLAGLGWSRRKKA